MSALLLALDTSTSTASVAVHDGERLLSETTWLAGREHSTRLLVEAERALERVGRAPPALTGLVVARGPGSFTGVRVALSVARGISAALSLPIWGVSSLDVVAHAVVGCDLPVRAVLEAGRGRFATALYRDGQCVEEPQLATPEQLTELLHERTVLIGELSADARDMLARTEQAVIASPSVSFRRAGVLAELGWWQAQRGDPGDATRLEAIYIST
ncbi:MAG: tRNA (adenosine(37)-N6)-threonylcarbamoyltransferase complex dimerization subunit type 1 TsaB [Chloroflexi bacterium]|nr:tRNA (adenosine(37)-N6)-threonylcarbamoyltransferase complex dimerization subunit type 1 TsaB [Chloroflexota bacterium]